MTAPMTPAASRRSLLAAPQGRAGATAVLILVAILMAAAAWDPSGLLAPIGGRGLPLLGSGGVYRWAPLVVGLPILLAATALPVVVIARRSATAWWVFLGTWIAVVGAAAWATAATATASALPMIGSHLSAGPALGFAAATSGFAAVKFLIVGLPVAAATALAFRLGPRAQDSEVARPEPAPVGASVTVMVAVAALAAIGPAARWWRGGSVGYAFPGFLAAPSAASGVLGFFAGTVVFVGLFAAAARAMRRRLSQGGWPATGVTVFLAAIVAGLGLGVVDGAIAAAVPDRIPEAGPDSWWISTSLMSVATGAGYGAAVGLAGAVIAGVAHSALRSPRRRVGAGMVAVLLVALVPVVGGTAPLGAPSPATAAASGGMERLQLLPARDAAQPAAIGDVTGRQVLLRGVNVNQLIDYYLRDPSVPATQPLTDADFAQMAAMGFNVVRLGMSWSRLEPERGVFDQSYLQQVREAVAMAKAHGVYTVLDMHEDAWGTALARPAEQCGGGTSPTTGWDGAPAWATVTDGTAHCQFMARDLAPAVATAFANFYTDRDGIQSELIRTWVFVAQAFVNEPAVAGYDLLNEPGIGAAPPISSGLLLGRYYDAAIDAIRAAERAGGGYAHLALFEPSVLWSGLGFDVTPPPGFTGDRQIVFAPHPYSESITMDQSLGVTIASIERNLAVSARAAASYGAALWTGEWGWFGDPSVDGAKVQRFAAAQDRLGIGGAFWVWRQGCGSPETGADATASGNLVRVDCRTGESLAPPAGFAQPLSRAYPRALPGRLTSLATEPNGGGLKLAATADADAANCAIELWAPGENQPRLATTGVDNPAYTKVSGGWQITGCARGAYTVTVSAAPTR